MMREPRGIDITALHPLEWSARPPRSGACRRPRSKRGPPAPRPLPRPRPGSPPCSRGWRPFRAILLLVGLSTPLAEPLEPVSLGELLAHGVAQLVLLYRIDDPAHPLSSGRPLEARHHLARRGDTHDIVQIEAVPGAYEPVVANLGEAPFRPGDDADLVAGRKVLRQRAERLTSKKRGQRTFGAPALLAHRVRTIRPLCSNLLHHFDRELEAQRRVALDAVQQPLIAFGQHRQDAGVRDWARQRDLGLLWRRGRLRFPLRRRGWLFGGREREQLVVETAVVTPPFLLQLVDPLRPGWRLHAHDRAVEEADPSAQDALRSEVTREVRRQRVRLFRHRALMRSRFSALALVVRLLLGRFDLPPAGWVLSTALLRASRTEDPKACCQNAPGSRSAAWASYPSVARTERFNGD